MLVQGKYENKEESFVVAEVQLTNKEYVIIQTALWTLKNETTKLMSEAVKMDDINKLYVMLQEITDLKHDLYETFNVNQRLEF
jgi:ferritin-like protein